MRLNNRRRHMRGSAAVETALSLTVLLLLFSVLMNVGHAMIVRHRLLGATSQAARVCSLVAPGAMNQCARAQVQAAMGNIQDACRGLDIRPEQLNIGGVDVMRLQTSCPYTGGVWTGILERWGGDAGRYTLRAEATMPTR